MEHSPLPIIDLAALEGAPDTRRQSSHMRLDSKR